ncbi:MAG: hypothetical protein JXP34_06225 [Planctomycetes bacterium]|nr:hypothetical protein [Planctomycetota bacterium]
MVLVLTAAVLAAAESGMPLPAPRIRPPEWLYGTPVSEASLAVRPVLLELWATW